MSHLSFHSSRRLQSSHLGFLLVSSWWICQKAKKTSLWLWNGMISQLSRFSQVFYLFSTSKVSFLSLERYGKVSWMSCTVFPDNWIHIEISIMGFLSSSLLTIFSLGIHSGVLSFAITLVCHVARMMKYFLASIPFKCFLVAQVMLEFLILTIHAPI